MNASGDKAQWIKFNHSVYTFDYKTIMFIFIIIIVSIVFYHWYHRRKRKYFEIFSEWQKIKKDIYRINPGQIKAMECVPPKNTEAVEKLHEEGMQWLDRYNLLIQKTEPLKELLSFRVLPIIDKSSVLYDTANRLISLLEGNEFDLDECEMLYTKSHAALHNIDIIEAEKEIWDLYGQVSEYIELINAGLKERLQDSLKEMRNGFDGNIEKTVEKLKILNRKIAFMSVAKSISTIFETTEKLKAYNFINLNNITERDTRIKINERLKNIYIDLSYDKELMKTIEYKTIAHNGKNKQLAEKEKALVLLIIYPKTDWNMIRFIYGIKDRSNDKNNSIIKNLRVTFSKVRKNIITKKDNIEGLMSPGSDSMALYFKDMLNQFVKE